MPSGLYLAEGFVMSSMDLIAEEGICFSNCAAGILEILPSTSTRTFSLPRKLMAPFCGSTLTEGIPTISSEAVPAAAKSLPMVMTFRSTFCSMVDTSAITSTSSRVVNLSVRYSTPTSTL